jgi:hypothetical protein
MKARSLARKYVETRDKESLELYELARQLEKWRKNRRSKNPGVAPDSSPGDLDFPCVVMLSFYFSCGFGPNLTGNAKHYLCLRRLAENINNATLDTLFGPIVYDAVF